MPVHSESRQPSTRRYLRSNSSAQSSTSRIASRGTSQSATDSPRRPYCSRAQASAKSASGATTEPACSNAAPRFSLRNTSQTACSLISGCEDDVAHPLLALEEAAAEREPLLGL